jgi:hypothetical protein
LQNLNDKIVMKKIKLIKYSIFIIFIYSITACGPTADFIADDFQQPNKIAVLPIINNTVDLTAGEVVRSVSFVNLYNYQYAEILELTETDSLMREFGITDGGQLASVDMNELYEVLECDGIFLIELKEASYGTVGARRENRIVHANYSLHSYGKKLYEHDVKIEKKSSSLVGGLLSVATNPVGALTDRAVDTAVKGIRGIIMEHELLPEINENFSEIMQTLPGDKVRRSRSERL